MRPGVITFECLWADLGQERKSHRCGTVEKCLASCAGEWHRYVGGLPRAWGYDSSGMEVDLPGTYGSLECGASQLDEP